MNELENMNHIEEIAVREEKPEEVLNDAVYQNDDVSKEGSVKRKDEAVCAEEENGGGGVEGLPARWGCLVPFAKKMLEMVEDPDTDPIVSWSSARDSFVIWDPHVFSNTILPKYFKHSNFSSFIHQLNTYGFRKVYPNRWEFANEGFQGGKKHLLKNIMRRKKNKKISNDLDQIKGVANSARFVLNDEIEKLKNDMNLLKLETLKLRQLHENTLIQLTNFEEQVQSAESRPSVAEQLIMHMMKPKNELDVDYEHQCSEQFDNLPELLRDNCFNFTGTSVNNINASSLSLSSAYDVMLEKLMEESYVIVDKEADVLVSKMYLQFEDLISKPVD